MDFPKVSFHILFKRIHDTAREMNAKKIGGHGQSTAVEAETVTEEEIEVVSIKTQIKLIYRKHLDAAVHHLMKANGQVLADGAVVLK